MIANVGILSWIVTGSLVTVLLGMVKTGRPVRKRGEWMAGVVAAILAGLVATGLDFGGLDEIEPRAMIFAALASATMVALWRILAQMTTDAREPDLPAKH